MAPWRMPNVIINYVNGTKVHRHKKLLICSQWMFFAGISCVMIFVTFKKFFFSLFINIRRRRRPETQKFLSCTFNKYTQQMIIDLNCFLIGYHRQWAWCEFEWWRNSLSLTRSLGYLHSGGFKNILKNWIIIML